MTAYDKTKVRRLVAMPDEEKTPEYGIDIPEEYWTGLHYGDEPVVDVGWWFSTFYVWFDLNPDEEPYYKDFGPDEDLPVGAFEDLRWDSWAEDDGTIVIDTSTAVGVFNHEEAAERDSPGANNAERIYDVIEKMGVKMVVENE